MDVILREAQKRDMRVWLLDDKHFPTGYANGAMEKHPELRKWFLRERHIDVMGSMPGCTLLLEDTEDELLGVYAYPRAGAGSVSPCDGSYNTASPYNETLCPNPVRLTESRRGRWIGWDVPDGCWRVFFLYRSRKGGSPGQDQYIDMLRAESVRVLIDAVYEPHYRRYQALFGNTFAGFFSDEPSLGNDLSGHWTTDYGMYDRRLGMPGLALPWSDALPALLRAGGVGDGHTPDPIAWLPALWYPVESVSPGVRLAYMDAVTALYRDHFCRQLGDWSRAHGVEYIGHIIEDMNAHARLGCSGGHYFRSLQGQDMSGIDIVLHQVMPGFAHMPNAAICAGGIVDSAFFHYVLGKLGASLAHLEPGMRGRAMCEVFGAYGWAEGTPLMKWLIDFLLVRGINHFVPHAFTPQFPNPDCPPHFHAWGNDPQFGGFSRLMAYTNRMAHLLSGGVHQADVAILYHAEGEWMAERGTAMLTQEPAQALYDAHIDYDILPVDAICERMEVAEDGRLRVGEETFGCLVVPSAPYWPEKLLDALRALQAQGGTIVFVQTRPQCAADIGRVYPLGILAEALRQKGFASITAFNCPLLRIYHVRRGETSVYMLFNESVTESIDTLVTLPDSGDVLRLDALGEDSYRDRTICLSMPEMVWKQCVAIGIIGKGFDDTRYDDTNNHAGDQAPDDAEGKQAACEALPDMHKSALRVQLSPYQFEILVFGGLPEDFETYAVKPEWRQTKILDGLRWRIRLLPSVVAAADAVSYALPCEIRDTALFNVTGTDRYPDFSGTMQYQTEFELEDIDSPCRLDLGTVGQVCDVTLNGHPLGMRICPPYRYELTGRLQPGVNRLEVTVSNTLVHQVQDFFSLYVPNPPSGLLGPLTLWTHEKA